MELNEQSVKEEIGDLYLNNAILRRQLQQAYQTIEKLNQQIQSLQAENNQNKTEQTQ